LPVIPVAFGLVIPAKAGIQPLKEIESRMEQPFVGRVRAGFAGMTAKNTSRE
jgi:hypothetical protein